MTEYLLSLAAGVVGWLLAQRASELWRLWRRKPSPIEQVAKVATEQIDRLGTTIADIGAKLSEEQQAHEATASLLAVQKRRADELLRVVTDLERERDTWQRLYGSAVRGAGAAQAWLARDLGQAVAIGTAYAQRLRKHGEAARDLQVDPGLTELLTELGAQHPASGSAVPRAPGSKALEDMTPIPGSETTPSEASAI